MKNKYRAWCPAQNKFGKDEMFSWEDLVIFDEDDLSWGLSDLFDGYQGMISMQYIGIKDQCDKEFYIGDIGQFDNGDKFVLKMEEWLEVYVDWIGDPECEDQARDLCRISKAKIIGNILRKYQYDKDHY